MNKRNNRLQKPKRSRSSSQKRESFQSKISINSKGAGFVSNPEYERDIMIPNIDLNTALHGDEVLVEFLSKDKFGRLTGRVLKVLERAKNEFVGTLERINKKCLVVPDSKKMYADIEVDMKFCMEARNSKAVTKITTWNNPKINPQGTVLKILGRKGEHNAEMESIVYEKGFSTEFPFKVEEEAKKIEKWASKISAEEISKRRDFRDAPVMTIDPWNAKDFDDAVSVTELPNGNLEVGVHIADVSQYVRPHSPLDKEAAKREFSVYLVDRTIPMLPEALSNNICSLNPEVERLTFSAVFEMNKNAEIISRWFGKTIICSKKRFTYEEAQETLSEAERGNFTKTFAKELLTLNEIAKKLRERKFANGAIDFDTSEIEIKIDENGHPISITKKERLETHRLIEDLMLLANREVAEFIYKKDDKDGNKREGLMYRVHDEPNGEKISELAIFLKALGHDLPVSSDGEVSSKELNKVLAEIKGTPEEALVKTAMVRSMSKAIYSSLNKGHYGLAFEYYTHFTSPIRRYPDLLVHRILEKYLSGQKISEQDISYYEESAQRATDKEIAAAEAERDSKKYKQIEYMTDRIGETFEGVVSGIADWGIYIEETETLTEGLVPFESMNDYFEIESSGYACHGKKSEKRYAIGDKIKFRVKKADVESRTLEFEIV